MIGKENDKAMNRLEIIFNKIARIILYRLDFEKTNEWYLKLVYKRHIGKALNLNNPQTFNEKIQWLKLYDHNSKYTELVDKVEVKKYASDRIGNEHVIPTYKVYKKASDIDLNELPERFVMKCNHDSGSALFCMDKNNTDVSYMVKTMKKSLKHNYFLRSREWAYKNVKPRILVEKYIGDEMEGDLYDYKVFCFNGIPRLIQVDFDRHSNHRRNLYTTEWELIDGYICYPNAPEKKIERPEKLELMLKYASKLSEGIPQARVDFYYVDGEILFGEITLYHGGGLEHICPHELDLKMGDWIKLDNAKKHRRQ